jgi:hypothetical protein
MMFIQSFLFFITLFFLNGCSRSPKPMQSNIKGEYIVRNSDEKIIQIDSIQAHKRENYPWENGQFAPIPNITKDFFRCQGSSLNPPKVVQKGGEIQPIYDCGGYQRHSLPLREGKEFIYPILIDLLNEVQKKTGKKVVITCGHCCSDHHHYLYPEGEDKYSKHLLGAEVDFYVQGMEENPEKIISIIFEYYRENHKYANKVDYQEFRKDEKGDIWLNKEIYVRVVKKFEGRDFDNRHPYLYVSIRVRYDCEMNKAVIYTWEGAFQNIHRW